MAMRISMRTMIKNNVEYLYTAENTVNVAICHSMTESQNKKKNRHSIAHPIQKTCTEHLKVLNSVPEVLR